MRISAIIAFGKMLKRVNKFKPGPAIHNEIYCALVPLILVMQENNHEMIKVSQIYETFSGPSAMWKFFSTSMFQWRFLSSNTLSFTL